MKKDLILLILLILPAFAPLMQKGYFSMHDDLQSMRQYQLDKCFKDGQIPCRWVSDLGYGYGYPLFNYYPPFPYLVGQIYRWAGFAYIDVVKLVGITGFIATAIFTYLLGKEFWGRTGGLISAAFYTYAPYHSVDFYVRGAINEFWAMAFYPAIFYCTYKLISTKNNKWIIGTALSVSALMLSHNPMLMIFAPVLIFWCLFWIWKLKSVKSVFYLLISALWALGLAAFFTLPVLFETKFVSVWTLTSGYFNYLAHFLDLKQIFLRINWGYGESVYGRGDTMSFALGYLHWIVPLIILCLLPFSKELKKQASLILIFTFLVLSSLFMTHFKSTEIWKAVQPLEFLQFPWRFLTLAVFSASLLSGAIVLITKNKFILSCLFALLLLLNANYFRPRQWYPNMTDGIKFSGKSWQLLITSGIFDYLPIWAPQPPADGKQEDLVFVSGSGVYKVDNFRTNFQQYQVQASESATLELQTFYFPGWRVWLDKLEVPINPQRDPLLGRMRIDVSPGNHELIARFMNTPIRFIANSISLIAWAILVLCFVPLWWKR